MSPVRSHFVMPEGRSPCWTETLAAVDAAGAGPPPHAATTITSNDATRTLDMGRSGYQRGVKVIPAYEKIVLRRGRSSFTAAWIHARTCSLISCTRRASPAASAPNDETSIGSPKAMNHFDGSGKSPTG